MFKPISVCYFLVLLTVHDGHCFVREKTGVGESLETDLLEIKQQCSRLAHEVSTLKGHLALGKTRMQALASQHEANTRQIQILRTMVEEKTGSCPHGNQGDVKPAKDKWKFNLVNKISTLTIEDEKPPIIFSVVVLRQNIGDVIVVLDFSNKCVKSFWFDTQENQYLSNRFSLSLDNELNGLVGKMTKLNESQIAVTFGHPLSSLIYKLNVGPNVTLNDVLLLRSGLIWSICAMTSQIQSKSEIRFLIGRKGVLEIIKYNEEVIKTIDISADKYTEDPFYLALTPSGNILVSNVQTGIYCINQDGEELWRYKMTNPMSMHCDEEGNIYVANAPEHKVTLLSPDGKFITDVLTSSDDIENPSAVYYNSPNRRLYVGEFQDLRGWVHIFERE